MLLQLPSFSQIPGAHGVIQAAGPQLGPIVRDVYAAGPVGVALELPAEKPDALGEHEVRLKPHGPPTRLRTEPESGCEDPRRLCSRRSSRRSRPSSRG